ncbi:hypothetical protein OG609_01795 [Streptomyces sp. NBC_01224]|nr:hypothetical protein OG609_01795 [Streptomyces sp. NBC_01224]
MDDLLAVVGYQQNGAGAQCSDDGLDKIPAPGELPTLPDPDRRCNLPCHIVVSGDTGERHEVHHPLFGG